ncbi:MAG: ABC transporter transmembrane domain-containing protein, partial [Mucilaginibacter sp.]
MKTYFRLLSFAKPIEKFAIPYIVCTLLYVLFSSLIYPLLIPLLNTLFNSETCKPVAAAAAVHPGFMDISGWFKFYMNEFIKIEGPWGALKFICGVIIVTMVIGNLFRYLGARTMENLRLHTLLNLRRAVFNNVMDMHLGYFNNQRKGDIISKIASDVQVVQFSVTATLQVIFKEPFQMIVFLFFLFKISVTLTLGSLLVVPISAFIISKIVKKLKSQAQSAQQTYGNMISYLDESLQGVRIIKAFNATDFIKKRFDEENTKYSKILRS